MKNYRVKRIVLLSAVIAVVTVMCLAAVMSVASSGMVYAVPEPEFGNYYVPDYDSKDDAMNAADKLNEEICEEGFTLLKNENNALPLENGAKISLFGKSTSEMLYGLSSNYVHLRGNMTTLQQALQNAGFSLNPELVNFYNSSAASGSGRGSQPTNGTRTFGYQTGETPIEKYTEDLETSYEEYSSAAIVMFSRSSGEGWDLPRTMEWDGKNFTSGGRGQKVPGARSMDDHYLQLDQNEADLLKYVGERFSKVIVLLNTPSTFETGFLDDPGHYGYHENIKAALWLGYPGKTGINAIGRILKGEVNPSGKTVDTWARDFKKDPTWENFADNRIANGNKYTNLSSGNGSKYVIYKEGIYIGYRYYETRGYTEGLGTGYTSDGENAINGTTTSQWEDWYNAHVVYPFGYGLSYTEFSQEIVSTSVAENTQVNNETEIEITVKVSNIGEYTGKDVVQIYYTPPYFDGEIEKPHVVLAGFAKTDLIAPGEFQNVTVKVKVNDMAAYDYSDANSNGFKGYELEAGSYDIKLMRDAHNVIDSLSYEIESDIKIDKDSVTGNTVENRFDFVSDYLTDSTEEGGLNEKYMSRSDFEGTFPKPSVGLSATEELKNKLAEWSTGNKPSYSDQPWFVEEENAPTFGDDTGSVILSDLVGAEYNDPLWDDFLDQISLNTAKAIVCDGNYRSGIEVPALGIPRVINAGQPAGYMSLFSGMEGAMYAFFSSDVVTASTYNEELAYEKGIAIGNEALFGTGKGKSRFPGWYAPAADTHRSQFGGRNADYYSEDGMIAGKMAAGIIRGAMEKGVFCFMKHFALNEQEVDRIGMITWANEQSMREIYFKPFEIAVKEGKTAAIMSALSRIGPVWSGGCRELLTEVLRNEWGFCGMVVTDSYIGSYSFVDQMLLAGGDLELGNARSESSKISDATTLTALRRSVKNILWVMANSMAMNTGYATPPPVMNEYESFILPIGSLNLAYSVDLGTATINPDAFEGGVVPSDDEIVYALKPGSTLPTGLNLSSDGMLTGTPSEETSSHPFTVKATYGSASREATFFISITNSNGSIIYQGSDILTAAYVGKPYECSVAHAEIYKYGASEEEIANFPPITYSLKNASALPEGLTLSSDGIISGTPTKECMNYSFTVVAGALGFKDTEKTFTFSVGFTLGFEGGNLPVGKIGNSYFAQVTPAECDRKVKYSLKDMSSLPAGLTFTESGAIVGTPTEVVTDRKIVVVATAEYCVPVEAEYTLTIGMAFNAIDLPDGEVGSEYYASVDTAQGVGTPVYRLKEGSSLPDGITLSENGVISGTTDNAGVYTFTIVASSDGVVGDEITLKLYIAESADNGGCSNSVYDSIWILSVVCLAVIAVLIIKIKNKKGVN